MTARLLIRGLASRGSLLQTSAKQATTFKSKRSGRWLVHSRLGGEAVAGRTRERVAVGARTRVRLKSTLSSRRQKSTSVMPESLSQRTSMLGSFCESMHAVLLKPRTLPVPRWISPRHYEVTLSEICGHSSFILVAISYAVDDFLHLRIIAVAGSTAMLFFTYFHPHGRVLWLPFKWNVLFIAINSYRIGKVFLDQWRAQSLSEDLMRIRDEHFYVLDLRDFAKLVRLGQIETYEEGDVVVEQGKMNRYIRLVLNGGLQAQRDGIHTYDLEEGNFVSESGLHAGLLLNGKVESCCALVARENTRLIKWDRTELMETLSREKDLRRSLKIALSWDIVRKLKGQRLLLATGEIKNPEYWTLKRQEQTDARYDGILNNMLHHREYMNKWKAELNKYRTIHHIDDEHHRLALKRFGWTPEEFEAGRREGDDQPVEEEVKHDWKWWAHDLMMRLFG